MTFAVLSVLFVATRNQQQLYTANGKRRLARSRTDDSMNSTDTKSINKEPNVTT
jgi:hypothetical protein